MSELEITEVKDGEFQNGFLKGVFFYYTQLQKPNRNRETGEEKWEIKCVIDKETRKAYKAAFKQNNVYEIDNKEFEKVFKTLPPFPEQDEQYYVRMAISVLDANGDRIAEDAFKRPRVFLPTDTEDEIVDVTATTLVGNGSFGDVEFYTTTYKNTLFPKLMGMLVTDLIEYEGRSGGSGFGTVKNVSQSAPQDANKTGLGAQRITKEAAPTQIQEANTQF